MKATMREGSDKTAPIQGPAVLSLALGTVFGTVLTKIPISVRYFGTVLVFL